MAHSFAAIYVHLIFSTKNRMPWIRPDIEEELNKYHAGILRNHDSPMIATGGTVDHVHILFRLGRQMDVAALVEHIKTGSSKWIKTKGPEYKDFYWQSGYGAFSIGQSGVDAVNKYIANQKEHHRKKTFQEEFLEFLERYHVDYDERYLWD